ncbi:MAG: stress response translation initiation inhibitor YciH [Proteobacteria bacterium]|nr:stress response translation initiation inhibitor YciH [Pseudomonadota bacterium]
MGFKDSRIVYSTAHGQLCPNCRRPVNACVCPKHAPGVAKTGPVRVGRAIQGRAGKGVTVITGLALPATEIEQLARTLKQQCGSGGTVRDGVIEIQGEHRDAIVALLAKRGIEAKRSGG